MLNLLRKYMSADNYLQLTKDYQDLLKAKDNRTEWKKAQQIRKTIDKEPYLKRIYENLSSCYNYSEYKRKVNETKLVSLIQQNDSLRLFYHCSTYLGLLIESIIFDELAAVADVKQSFWLDNVQKVDLLCNGIPYQIKNISYLGFKDRIEMYQQAKVFFVFYIVNKQNIYFCKLNNDISFTAETVKQLTEYSGFQFITASELIKELAERGKQC